MAQSPARPVWRRWDLLLLGLVPIALAADWMWPERRLLTFALSGVAIIPLAAHIGRATEELTSRLGAGIGALLNATFGNAAEIIIGAFALRDGLTDLVKASITGSIIANVLLVFGAAAIAGGLRRPVVRFNRTAATMGTTMLLLSAVGLVVPALFHYIARQSSENVEIRLDTEIAVVLFVSYGLGLLFMLRTHRNLFGGRDEGAGHGRGRQRVWPSVLTLIGAMAAVALVSETLVGSVRDAAKAIGTSHIFIGVIVVAIVANAAEHYSAVLLAWRNNMDAALQIAVGSSTQIALFVAPALVFLSFVVGPAPMDLLFTVFEIAAVTVSVVTIAFIAHDGETHWMEGVQLVAVYIILALGFFFLPATR